MNKLDNYALFRGKGGSEAEQKEASKIFKEDVGYEIKEGVCGRYSTDLEFEGIEGKWNSVLFSYNEKCPRIKVADYYGNF